jgi:hypothetical protein
MNTLDTPKTITTSKTISSFLIERITVELNTSAVIQVIIFDSQGNDIGTKSLTMEHPDYVQWGTDDTYITTFVKAKLALIDSL